MILSIAALISLAAVTALAVITYKHGKLSGIVQKVEEDAVWLKDKVFGHHEAIAAVQVQATQALQAGLDAKTAAATSITVTASPPAAPPAAASSVVVLPAPSLTAPNTLVQ